MKTIALVLSLLLAIPFDVYGIVCAHVFIESWVVKVPILIVGYFAAALMVFVLIFIWLDEVCDGPEYASHLEEYDL